MTIKEWLLERVLGGELRRRVALAVAAVDDGHDRALNGAQSNRDRWNADREELLRGALEAWRVNPLARRIVALTSQYVVGGGVSLSCADADTQDFLRAFWGHPLNRMDMRVFELCDELTRSGEVFVLLSTDPGGMSYVRAVPALEIAEIETSANDLEQETRFMGRGVLEDGRVWQGYCAETDAGQSPVMLHYAVNRPVGSLRGESDLAPLLRWLARYAAWLEDRARLNRYRFAFLYSVTLRGSSEAERRKRQAELNSSPPQPGSILVKGETEDWGVLNPQLEAGQASEDGLALKKMIAAGAGVPLHFLAEPESSTRTTAESAGGPTFRHYEQRQEYFTWMLSDLLRVALRRAALAGRRVAADAPVSVICADVSARDNAALAVAASTVSAAFAELRDRGLIDDAELLRMAYRFAGETLDVEAMLKRGRKAGAAVQPRAAARRLRRPAHVRVQPDGSVRGDGGWESA